MLWKSRLAATGLIAILGFFTTCPARADAGELGCSQEPPLLNEAWDEHATPECSALTRLHDWRLPISSSKPEIVTAAQVAVHFEKPSAESNWFARVYFSFPDPKPFGIPFTFQKLRLSWQTPYGEHSKEVDWSSGCQNVGRGMFPGQEFEVRIELPDTSDHCFVSGGGIKLWGGRY